MYSINGTFQVSCQFLFTWVDLMSVQVICCMIRDQPITPFIFLYQGTLPLVNIIHRLYLNKGFQRNRNIVKIWHFFAFLSKKKEVNIFAKFRINMLCEKQQKMRLRGKFAFKVSRKFCIFSRKRLLGSFAKKNYHFFYFSRNCRIFCLSFTKFCIVSLPFAKFIPRKNEKVCKIQVKINFASFLQLKTLIVTS